MDVCTVGHSVGFSVSDTDSVYHCNYVFVSEENDANIIWIFLSDCFELPPSLAWRFASLIATFEHI